MSDEGNFWEGADCANPLNEPDWWFEPIWEQRAKRICESCPLKNKCLAYALEHQEANGVWGGLNPDQRKRIRIRPSEGKHNGK